MQKPLRLQKVQRHILNQIICKIRRQQSLLEKILDSLSKSLRDLVRGKFRTQYNETVPWETITYGQLTSQIQQITLKVCTQDKMLRQLAKD